MRSWLIRTDAPSIQKRDDEFYVVSTRKPRFASGDLLVFVSGIDGDFYQFAVVSDDGVEEQEAEVSARAFAHAPGIKLRFRVPISEVKRVEDPIDVGALRYSLTFVRKLERPAAHFRRGYRSLPREDVETIKLGEAFIARSAYYELLGALPLVLRVEFEAGERISDGAARARPDFRVRLSRLNAFLQEHIYAAGDLLDAIDVTLNQLGMDQGYAHFFVNEQLAPNGQAEDSIGVQAERFRLLSEALRRQPSENQPVPKNFVDEVLVEISESELAASEQLFETRFRRFE